MPPTSSVTPSNPTAPVITPATNSQPELSVNVCPRVSTLIDDVFLGAGRNCQPGDART
jgi:hypothetical protein